MQEEVGGEPNHQPRLTWNKKMLRNKIFKVIHKSFLSF